MIITDEGDILFKVGRTTGNWHEVGGFPYHGSGAGPWHVHTRNILLKVEYD